jgi:hypothetical protein
MQDRNSENVFNIIDLWLRQIGTTTIGGESRLDNEISIDLYPNPTGNAVWIDERSMNGHEYCIYSIDGRMLKESTVMNQRIDLTGAPNGLLLVGFRYKEQLIIMKVIKRGF